jgi:hypothetical protein
VTWPNRFLAFFREIEKHFSVILQAEGCREGWLQGEFFRHFRENGVQVNYPGLDRAKHDLYCKLPSEMLVEIKVYVDDIRGTEIKRFVRSKGGDPLSHADILNLDPPNGSYLRDVLRLMERPTPPDERYMILVLPKEGDRAISGLHVVAREHETEENFGTFRVRISRIQGI